jgi:hypothetical protein
MTDTSKKTSKGKKPTIPMDERAVKALAALLEGVTPETFDQGLQALVEGLKPRISQEWHKRQARKNIAKLSRPIENAMAADCGPEEVAQAILADPEAVKIIQQLGTK